MDFFTAWARSRSLLVVAAELLRGDPDPSASADVEAYDFLLATFGRD